MNATFPTLALALSTAASPTDNNVHQSVTGTGTWLQMSLPTINHVYPHGSSIIDNRNEHQSLVDLRLIATSTSEPAPFAITDIMLTQPDSVNLTFNSEPGKLDEVLSGSDLSAINQSEGTVAANAARTRFTRTAALTHREFFRVADPGSTPPLGFTAFENGDDGFTNTSFGSKTDWKHGLPDSSGVGGIIAAGHGGTGKCWASNLGDSAGKGGAGVNATGTDASLRSPVIDLTDVTAASVTFAQAMDLAPTHAAVVNIIEESTGTVIAPAIHTFTPDLQTTDSAWRMVAPIPIPAAALGRRMRIEWRFTGDGDNPYMGGYIDDVVPTRS